MADAGRALSPREVAAATHMNRRTCTTRLSGNRGRWFQSGGGRGCWEPTASGWAWLRQPQREYEGRAVRSGASDIDPGSEYTAEQLEFVAAVVEFQKRHGRKFLAHTDYLTVAWRLGYRREKGSEVTT